jgi:hypothetical protein
MFRSQVRLIAIGLSAASGLVTLGATPCLAQMGVDSTSPTSMQAVSKRIRGGAEPAKPEPAPPPVLPGTKGASEAAPATASAAAMTPTDALFDAINRGDSTAARDAVNRGANLDGQNILGLSPLELSVDLGRNDISFLLLSMRGEDPGVRREARGLDQSDSTRRTSAAPRAAARARVIPASAPPDQEADAGTPRLYSGNGGAPIPAAGFLGFGSGRSTR